MSKIKFKLTVAGPLVAFQILEMDERFRADARLDARFNAQNGYCIASSFEPELELTTVFLRGSARYLDLAVVTREFSDYEAACEYANRIVIALRDWAQNWEGWRDEPTQRSEIGEGVFTIEL